MIFVGIDPGKKGALVILNNLGQIIEAVEMPEDRNGLVGGQISTLLRNWVSTHGEVRVTTEKLMVMPKNGAVAALSYGLAGGVTLGVLIALKIPFTQVIPRQWSSWAHQGIDGETTKDRSAAAAQQRWPGYEWPRYPRSKKLHDGIIDAALIAEWGRINRWQQKTVDLAASIGKVEK